MSIFYKIRICKYIYSLLLWVFLIGSSYAQDFSWVKRFGATGEDIIYATAVDFANNVYATGTFSGTVNFNETASSPVQLASSGALDIFITKTASDGALLWAKRIGGVGSEYALALGVDETGAVYITGRFAGTIDFDPGAGTFNLSGAGSSDIFVLKLDALGNFVWAKKMGGTGWDVGNALAVDKDKNIVITGRFDGTANFNTNINETAISLTATGQDIFVVKLNADGNTIWANKYGGNQDDWGQGIDVDNNGAVYVTGFFREEVVFGSLPNQTLASVNATRDIFLLKLASSGETAWAKQIGNNLDDRGEAVNIDFEGNVLLTGRIAGTNILFGENFSLSPGGNFDAFIAKLNPEGEYIWVKSLEGTGDAFGLAVDTDKDGAVYFTGNFKGIVDLNPSACDLQFVSAGDADVYIVKLDTDGQFVWGRQMGGISTDVGNTISVDLNGNVYTAGYFTGEANFNANFEAYNITSNGDKDAFLHKVTENVEPIDDLGVLPLYIVNFKGNVESNFNNLRWNSLQAQNQDLSFEIQRTDGEMPFRTLSTIAKSNNKDFYYIDKSPLAKDNYYRIKQKDKNGTSFYTETILLDRSKFLKKQFNLYPNPITNNLLTISSSDGTMLGNITIVDSSGKTILRLNSILKDTTTINTSSWSAGLYLIEIRDKTHTNHFKIIK